MTELGITGIVDSFVSFDDVKVYQELWAKNELTVRTKLLLSLVPFTPQQVPVSSEKISLGPAGLSAQVGLPPKDDMLRIDGLKTIADGGIEGAFMRKPYLTIPEEQEDPSYVGKLILSRDVFKAQCMRAAQNDWRLGCHVVGDAGMDHLLDVWEEVNRETPIVNLHWSIIHAFMPGQNFERIKRLGAYVTCQHAHTYTMGDSMVKWWGTERANRSNPVKEYMEHGVMVGDGTDAFVNEWNPSVLFWFDRTRKSKFAGVLGSDLVLTPEESLRYHTINAAYMSDDEDKIGSIEVGKLADLVIISEDILTCPVDNILHMEVLTTMVGGNIVYER